MIKYKKIQSEITVFEKIWCNKCGVEMPLASTYEVDMAGCSISVHFGYGSNKDGNYYEFELCDNCFDELIRSLKVKPGTGSW